MKIIRSLILLVLLCGEANATTSSIRRADLIENNSGGNYLTVPATGSTVVSESNTTTFTNKTWNGVTIGHAFGGTDITSPGASGNVLTSNGTNWTSAVPSAGSSSVATAIDVMIKSIDSEHQNVFETPIATAAYSSFAQAYNAWNAVLLGSYTASDTKIYLAVNTTPLVSGDKNFDSTTNWSASGSATNLQLSNTSKLGTKSLSIDKSSTSTTSGGLQNTSLSITLNTGNQYFYEWVNISSTTNVSSFSAYLSPAANFTNNAQFKSTTQCDGTAFATGWNFICFNVGGTAFATTGTGWDPTKVIDAVKLEIDMAAAGNTLNAVLFDNPIFGDSTGIFFQVGDELDIYDGTHEDSFIIAGSNTSNLQGQYTLVSTVSNSYTADNTSTAVQIVRTPLIINGNNQAAPLTGKAGTIVNTQNLRVKRYLPQSLSSATVEAAAIYNTQKLLAINAIVSNTITVTDPADWHLQFLSGNTIHAIQPIGTDSKIQYLARSQNPSLTGNATHSGSNTSIALSSASGLAVGDLVILDQLTPKVSTVTAGSSESFSSMTFKDLEPVNLGITIPEPTKVGAHYYLGGYGTQNTTNFVVGSIALPNLSTNGTISFLNAFFNGQFSAGPFTNSNYFNLTTAQSTSMVIDTTGQCAAWSVWFYPLATPGGNDGLIVMSNTGNGHGYAMYATASSKVTVFFNGTTSISSSNTFTNNKWHNAALNVCSGGNTTVWLDGVATTSSTGSYSSGGAQIQIGTETVNNVPFNGYLADALLYPMQTSAILTQTDVNQIYNNGIPIAVGNYASLKNRWTATGQTGNALTGKLSILRNTDADDLSLSGVTFNQQ